MAQSAGKFPWARHDAAPAAPTSRLCARSSDSSCRNAPGTEGSASRELQKSALYLSALLWQVAKNRSCPLSGHLPERRGQVRLASPSFHYAWREFCPLYCCHINILTQASQLQQCFILNFNNRRNTETEMGTEQVPATGKESFSLVCCIIARYIP